MSGNLRRAVLLDISAKVLGSMGAIRERKFSLLDHSHKNGYHTRSGMWKLTNTQFYYAEAKLIYGNFELSSTNGGR